MPKSVINLPNLGSGHVEMNLSTLDRTYGNRYSDTM